MTKFINLLGHERKEFRFYRETEVEMTKKAAFIKGAFIQVELSDESFRYYLHEKYKLTTGRHPPYPNFSHVMCSCVSFFLRYTCKHCIALAQLNK